MDINIALSTIVYISIFLFPGILFRKFLFIGVDNKQFYTGHLFERIFCVNKVFKQVSVFISLYIFVAKCDILNKRYRSMQKEFLKINLKKQEVSGGFHAVGFMDGASHIVYIPSLQLSAYGDTPDEAQEMMEDVLQVFSQDILDCTEAQLNTLLSQMGWQKERFFPKRRIHLSRTTFEDIKKEFNLPDTVEGKEFELSI